MLKPAEIGSFPVTNPCDSMTLKKKPEENSLLFLLVNEAPLTADQFQR